MSMTPIPPRPNDAGFPTWLRVTDAVIAALLVVGHAAMWLLTSYLSLFGLMLTDSCLGQDTCGASTWVGWGIGVVVLGGCMLLIADLVLVIILFVRKKPCCYVPILFAVANVLVVAVGLGLFAQVE